MKFNAAQILEEVLSLNASDLHLTFGTPPVVRIHTQIKVLDQYDPLALEDLEMFLSKILDKEQKDLFDINKDLDLSVALGHKVRFRVNAFFQRGYPSVALRVIPNAIPTIEQLNLPILFKEIAKLNQGLVLVVGPTGSGKSTTIAALIEEINMTRSEHIVTIEDPIEYVFTNKKSIIAQREMYLDTNSWENSLRSVLRQDPDVVLVGEMRDKETINSALQIAETGHLVFATLHTHSAASSVERIVNVFNDGERNLVRQQLANVIEVVVSQRLLASEKVGSVPAVELLLVNDAVRNTIREGKTQMIDNIISTSKFQGMMSLERSLAELAKSGVIDEGTAISRANKPEEVRRLLKS